MSATRFRLWLTAAPLLLAVGIPASPARAQGIEKLGWLAGCWEFTSAQGTVEEQWMEPRGMSMLGMSRTVRGARLTAWETVLIREDSSGAISYNAYPGAQPPAVFPAAEVSDSHAVFENPAHDFPQRIIYRRRGALLAARVEGNVGGAIRGSDFPYRKTACSGEEGGGRH